MKTVTYEHVTFNATWAATKSEADFVAHESHHGLTVTQLKEAYKLCIEAVKPPAKAVGDSKEKLV